MNCFELDYKVDLKTVCSGYEKEQCWVHGRAGAIPRGNTPLVVMTLQRLLLSECDVFGDLKSVSTEDFGESWSEISDQNGFARKQEGNLTYVACDFTPKWHKNTGKLLGTGHTACYTVGESSAPLPAKPAYSVYDEKSGLWADWKTIQLPDIDLFFKVGAGCTQRVDLDNGDVLLPVYSFDYSVSRHCATVLKCSFDGKNLTYMKHGDFLTIEKDRGMYEPSLTYFGDTFFMTIRAQEGGYVTYSKDGMSYKEPVFWRWDDGEILETYDTQQHWVTHSDGLYLVYTRADASNAHVFRRRAPLFMSRVDTERLCLIRETERIVVPERGARLGNFGTVNVNSNETWVTVCEWMQPDGCESYGSDNSVYASRILWNKENHTV